MEKEDYSLKLYSFDSSGWGYDYHVMAKSPQDALYYLKDSLVVPEYKKYIKNFSGDKINSYEYDQYLFWEKATIDNLPKHYYISEYSVGEVLSTEKF